MKDRGPLRARHLPSSLSPTCGVPHVGARSTFGGFPARGPLLAQGDAERARFVSDVRDYLFASDVFILASEIEGLCNALLEAMAAGLLCVCTRTPGTEDVIEHGQNGLIAELDHVSVSSQLFSALQMTPSTRSKIQDAAKATVFSRFDLKDSIRRGLDVLELPMRDREHTTAPQGYMYLVATVASDVT